MHWVADYLGRPYRAGANGPHDYDCWGLVRAVLRDRAEIVLPQAPLAIASGDHASVRAAFRDDDLYRGWREVDDQKDFDAVLMTQARYPSHVGVSVEGRVLHAIRGGVCLMDSVTLAANGFRILKRYRHDARA